MREEDAVETRLAAQVRMRGVRQARAGSGIQERRGELTQERVKHEKGRQKQGEAVRISWCS